MRDLAEIALAAAGVGEGAERIRSHPALVRPVDIPEMLGDSTKAQISLGWRPKVSLQDVVRKMVVADSARAETGLEHDQKYM